VGPLQTRAPSVECELMPDFQHSVSVAVSRCRTRFRKNRVRTGRLYRCCWGMCAAIARKAQEPGRRVSRAKEWAEFQARTNGRYGKIGLDPIWTDERQRRTYGNGERYFLRKLRSSYGILTDERNSYALCYGNGYGNGYAVLEIRHKNDTVDTPYIVLSGAKIAVDGPTTGTLSDDCGKLSLTTSW